MRGISTRGKNLNGIGKNSGFSELRVVMGDQVLYIPQSAIRKKDGIIKKNIRNLLKRQDYSALKEKGVVIQ